VSEVKRRFSYRPDIDAMRGIAVLAVFIYHLNEAWLPGGFAGVDIFFVISGYVVTGSIIGHSTETPWQQLSGFYLVLPYWCHQLKLVACLVMP
jgi:peptidoglycan/LPS O-acetylase OafA/YrhL